MVSKAKPTLTESLMGARTKFVESHRLSCFVVAGFQGLITAAHFESLPLWFRLPSRWRREAVHLLTKPRNTQARRPEGKRVLALAGVRHQKKLTVDLTSRKDAIQCQRPGECMSGIGRPIAFPIFCHEP